MSIPEAAIEAAASRILGHNRLEAKQALEAAMPAIREALAQEIEAYRGAEPKDWMSVDDQDVGIWNGLEDAARIVRGGTTP